MVKLKESGIIVRVCRGREGNLFSVLIRLNSFLYLGQLG